MCARKQEGAQEGGREFVWGEICVRRICVSLWSLERGKVCFTYEREVH